MAAAGRAEGHASPRCSTSTTRRRPTQRSRVATPAARSSCGSLSRSRTDPSPAARAQHRAGVVPVVCSPAAGGGRCVPDPQVSASGRPTRSSGGRRMGRGLTMRRDSPGSVLVGPAGARNVGLLAVWDPAVAGVSSTAPQARSDRWRTSGPGIPGFVDMVARRSGDRFRRVVPAELLRRLPVAGPCVRAVPVRECGRYARTTLVYGSRRSDWWSLSAASAATGWAGGIHRRRPTAMVRRAGIVLEDIAAASRRQVARVGARQTRQVSHPEARGMGHLDLP